MKGIIRWAGPYRWELAPEPAPLPLKGVPEATWIEISMETPGQPLYSLGLLYEPGCIVPADMQLVTELANRLFSSCGGWILCLRPTCLCVCAQLRNFCPLPQNGSQKRGKDTRGLTNMVDISIQSLERRTFCHSWV